MTRRGRAAAGVAGAALVLAFAGGSVAADQPKPAAGSQVNDRPDNFGSAVASPAEDLNLRKTAIPEVLQRAVANPYDMRTLERCPAIGAEVTRLDGALGPDQDAPPPAARTAGQKRNSTAATVLRTGVEAVTPYRGIIRRITGASAHAKKVEEAIEAGFARRGFLKGMALKMNCPPPASPAWFKPAAPPRPVVRTANPPPARRTR